MVRKDEPIDGTEYTRWVYRNLLFGADGTSATNVQNPIPTDGDSLYCKDIDITNSDLNNFSGSACDLVDNLKTLITDSTTNNPKILKLWFNRTVYAHDIGLGCDDLTKGFGTDITIKLLGSSEVVRFTKNYTGLDPNSALLEFGPKAFNGLILEFNTASEVCVSNLTIRKAIETTSTLQALKPDGDITNIDATAGGNLKISLEEYDTIFDTLPLPVVLTEVGGRKQEFDNIFSVPIVIQHGHHEIHEGDTFTFSAQATLASGATRDYLLVTPSTDKLCHFVHEERATGEFNVIIYEDTVTSSDGTIQTVFNRNRNILNLNTTLLYLTPTVTSVGTNIWEAHGGQGQITGGEIREQDEFVLKANTKYLIRITSESASNDVSWIFDWYEHTNE